MILFEIRSNSVPWMIATYQRVSKLWLILVRNYFLQRHIRRLPDSWALPDLAVIHPIILRLARSSVTAEAGVETDDIVGSMLSVSFAIRASDAGVGGPGCGSLVEPIGRICYDWIQAAWNSGCILLLSSLLRLVKEFNSFIGGSDRLRALCEVIPDCLAILLDEPGTLPSSIASLRYLGHGYFVETAAIRSRYSSGVGTVLILRVLGLLVKPGKVNLCEINTCHIDFLRFLGNWWLGLLADSSSRDLLCHQTVYIPVVVC